MCVTVPPHHPEKGGTVFASGRHTCPAPGRIKGTAGIIRGRP